MESLYECILNDYPVEALATVLTVDQADTPHGQPANLFGLSSEVDPTEKGAAPELQIGKETGLSLEGPGQRQIITHPLAFELLPLKDVGHRHSSSDVHVFLTNSRNIPLKHRDPQPKMRPLRALRRWQERSNTRKPTAREVVLLGIAPRQAAKILIGYDRL